MITQAEYSNLKRRLTTAQNKVKNAPEGDKKKAAAQAVVAEAERAEGIFNTKGHPDDWSRWERAKEDAQMVIRFGR